MQYPAIHKPNNPYAKTAFPFVTPPRCDSGIFAGAGRKPFFSILNDHGVASRFLAAVAANPDEAWAFVSKHYVHAIDLDALRDVLCGGGFSRSLTTVRVKAAFNRDPKNCSTSSVLVSNPDRGEKSILHLHMIKEPDHFGQWKIYGVEQE